MSLPALPALRQPKFTKRPEDKKISLPDTQYVIVTLKNDKKLVISSDAYHGIITVGEMYKCVFCQEEMELDSSFKENHKKLNTHLKLLQKYPPVEEYAENLIRKLTEESSFCTICNVAVANVHLIRHLHTEVHSQELQKAGKRATNYKPY